MGRIGAQRSDLKHIYSAWRNMPQDPADLPSTNRSASLFANTLILSSLRAVAAGPRGFMRINKRRPTAETKTLATNQGPAVSRVAGPSVG